MAHQSASGSRTGRFVIRLPGNVQERACAADVCFRAISSSALLNEAAPGGWRARSTGLRPRLPGTGLVCHCRSERKERAMGSSNDDEDQDQQPSNFGPLALFGFMFWSMAGSSHGAEPTARPRPRPGGELKSLPLAPPTSLEGRRKGPAPGDIHDALPEDTRGPARGLFSRWRPAAFRRRAPASATSARQRAQGGDDEVTRLGWEDEWITQKEVDYHLGLAGKKPAGYRGGVGEAGGSVAPWRSASLERVLADTPRTPRPGAGLADAGRTSRLGSASPVGGEVNASSLPRSAVRADMDKHLEELAVRYAGLWG